MPRRLEYHFSFITINQEVSLQMKNINFLFISFVLFFSMLSASQAEVNSPSKLPTVKFETSLGSFSLELYPARAPATVANFLSYVDQGFYKGTIFHRIIPGFMAQGGGFEKGMNKKTTGPAVKNESNNGLNNIRGSIAMARTRDPDSATAQFYINVADNYSLDAAYGRAGYTVFGKVIAGMDIVDKIVNAKSSNVGPFANVPVNDITILSAEHTNKTE